jgi:hypothetical protein
MTQRRHLPGGAAACLLLLLFLISGALAQTIQVTDADGHSTSVTTAQIFRLPHVTVAVQDHDKPTQFESVPLSSILSLAGILLGDALRGPRMSDVLVVGAIDGYKVAFALAEIDPAFATREIVLADKRDGKPLDDKEGPLRVVAPGDKRPARWVRQVITLRIVAAK